MNRHSLVIAAAWDGDRSRSTAAAWDGDRSRSTAEAWDGDRSRVTWPPPVGGLLPDSRSPFGYLSLSIDIVIFMANVYRQPRREEKAIASGAAIGSSRPSGSPAAAPVADAPTASPTGRTS